jgi:anti-sigma B factor antagonist
VNRSVLVLRVCGELDMDSRSVIEPAIVAAVVSAESVVLDLAELTFCDSSGIAMFCAIREKAIAEETPLALRNLVGVVARVFSIAGIDALFNLIE